jgi:large subunit ribosomal protein L17
VLEPLTAKKATVREAEAATRRAAKKAPPQTKVAPEPAPRTKKPAGEPVEEPAEAAEAAGFVEAGKPKDGDEPPAEE